MSTFDRASHRAIALHQRLTFLESQIAELDDLRDRVAQAELRRHRSRSSRRASEKSSKRRHRK
jgi:hypothetical protein